MANAINAVRESFMSNLQLRIVLPRRGQFPANTPRRDWAEKWCDPLECAALLHRKAKESALRMDGHAFREIRHHWGLGNGYAKGDGSKTGIRADCLAGRCSYLLWLRGIFAASPYFADALFGTSLARPSVAQELAAQVIGVRSFALPGEPSGVDRESIGQLPSGFCVATKKSTPRLIAGCSAVKPASAKTYKVWPVAKASLLGSGTVWLQPPSARCRASSSSIVPCSARRGSPERTPRSSLRTLS